MGLLTQSSRASDLFCSFSSPAIKYTMSCSRLVTALRIEQWIKNTQNNILFNTLVLQNQTRPERGGKGGECPGAKLAFKNRWAKRPVQSFQKFLHAILRMIEGNLLCYWWSFWKEFLNARKLGMIFQCLWQDKDEEETKILVDPENCYFLLMLLLTLLVRTSSRAYSLGFST